VLVFSSHHDKRSQAAAKQEDIELAKVAIGRYTNYRFNRLPFLFSAPLSILAYRLLPRTMHHHVLLAMLIGFGIGIPAGEAARALWLHYRSR